jgi:Zn-dependent protease
MELDASTLSLGLVWYVAFLFSLTVHEASHALVALRLGDPTAYRGGQVTLNPVPHIRREPFGTVVVPVLSYLFAGWMMGWASAPYDPRWAERHPRRAGWMALAGPVSNLLLVVLAGIGIRVGIAVGALEIPSRLGFTSVVAAAGPGVGEGLATFLSILFSLNLVLFLFNLVPVPPLDGSAVLQLVLERETAARWQEFLRQPMMSLVGIIIAWRAIGYVFGPAFAWSLRALYPELAFG